MKEKSNRKKKNKNKKIGAGSNKEELAGLKC